jgi:hypothetical protein
MKSIHSAQLGSAPEAINWRSKFENSPTVFLAAALGGGLLIGSATNHRKAPSATQPRRARREFEAAPAHRSLGWDWNDSLGVVKSILIGIAITQAKKMLVNSTHSGKATSSGTPKPAASHSATH